MREKLFYNDHNQCKNCKESQAQAFKYIESPAGDKFIFENIDTYTLVFILTGEALISCNEFTNVLFKAGEMCLFPITADCVWETVKDATGITLATGEYSTPCDKELLKYHSKQWLNAQPSFFGMQIKPRLQEMLLTVKNYLQDGITCQYMHQVKQQELSVIFRAYYSCEELAEFFLPTIKDSHEFEYFIMKNYLNMKGVKEFVDLSGLNVSTFNRKFKAHFGVSPYQWMLKQKSKHILHALTTRDKSIADIMREFEFSDASHFNRYCKAMFGAPPSELRIMLRKKNL